MVQAGTAAEPSSLVFAGSGPGSATCATATIGGVSTSVGYARKQGSWLPWQARGQVDVVVTEAGKPSNTVNITLQ